MSQQTEDLELIATEIYYPHFVAQNEAREKALRLCRQIIQNSANAIRAVHRQEEDKARHLLDLTHDLIQDINNDLREHGELLHSGFVHDAQKEFAEGCITLALINQENLPRPAALGIGYAAYLNGLGEAMGELRRYILDSLRRGDFSRCEELLSTMDDVYGILMTMDFPEVVTHGLRRTTDAVRGIVERTRGDLTSALRQKDLEAKLGNFGTKRC
jgi:translin